MFKGNEKAWRRWHGERMERVIRDEVRDLRNIRDISAMVRLIDMLPDRAASLLSVNSLREDLGVAHQTVSGWLETL